jgi:hypothetical protein
MPALNFPSSPTLDQIYTAPSGQAWQWDGTAWISLPGESINAVTRHTVPNRFTADHTGWKVGDIVEQVGIFGTVTIPGILPFDPALNTEGVVEFQLIYDAPSAEFSSSLFLIPGTHTTAEQMAVLIAEELNQQIPAGLPGESLFTASGTTVTGVLSPDITVLATGQVNDYSSSPSFSGTPVFTDSFPRGNFVVLDPATLNSVDGYGSQVSANKDATNVDPATWRTRLSVPARDITTGKVLASDVFAQAGDVSLIDFRQLANGPITSIRPQCGTYEGHLELADSSGVPGSKYSISNGALICSSMTAGYLYLTLVTRALTQHTWAIVEFGALETLRSPAFTLVGLPALNGWPASGRFTVHPVAFAKEPGGAAAGRVSGGGAFVVGQVAPSQNGIIPGYTFPGKTVRFDTVFDAVTGRVALFINRTLVLTYLDVLMPPLAGREAIFEFDSPGIRVLEYGASSRYPHEMFVEQGRAELSGTITNAGALSSTWVKLRDIRIAYPPSGVVDVTWNVEITSTSGEVEMELGPTAGTVDAVTKQIVAANAYRGRAYFSRSRVGAPRTTELVSIWARTTGVASVANTGGEGPRITPVSTEFVNSP